MTSSPFPPSFLWGVAGSGHQTEGDAHAADTTFLEHTSPTIFREPSGPACRSLQRWADDLDLVAGMGLRAFRFSVEWARVEPEPGVVSAAALDHYEAVVDGCLERGLAPLVTFSHFTAPHWFSARGNFLAPDAAERFAGQCDRVMTRFGDRIALAITLNEPNLEQMLQFVLPPEAQTGKRAMLEAAARAAGTPRYRSANVVLPEETDAYRDAFTAAHRAARAAIKGHRPDLSVGFSIAITDEFALPGGEASRDAKRAAVYDHWLQVAGEDDFVGVQNYERIVHGPDGVVPPAEGAVLNGMGTEVEPASLAGAVRYAHERAGVPVLVSEHGIQTDDDAVRDAFVPAAIELLAEEVAAGTPVLGYCHWTLMDNFEWIFGYRPRLGLFSVDRETFERIPKPSAGTYADVVRAHRSAPVPVGPGS